MYAALLRHTMIPAWYAYDGYPRVLKQLQLANAASRSSRAEIEATQKRSLHKLLTNAVAKVPFYKDLQVDADDPHSSLTTFPIMSKPKITERLEELRLIAGDTPVSSATTGGSTGIPLTFYRTNHCVEERKAQELHFDLQLGFKLGEPVAIFVAPSHFDGLLASWKAKIRNATNERAIRFDPYSITPEYVEFFAKQLRAHQPTLVRCFPNALMPFIEIAKEQGAELPAVEAVTCTGENLYPHQIEEMQQALQCQVYEKYATKECGVIASECPAHSGLHIFEPGLVVELLQLESDEPTAPGELGRIVVTDLHNYGTAMIRYEIGDLGIMVADQESCECGSMFKRFKRVLGRDRDLIRDAQGLPKPGYLFVEALTKSPLSGLQMQIEQVAKDRLELRVCADQTTVPEHHVQEVTRSIESLATGLNLTVTFVDDIPRDPSGKYRYVIGLQRP
ncbi:MAG: phenylacetate--CoA ligase family protein [Pseudomonadales bacterium]